jgi:ABC-type cobalamin transport system permease subunit
MILLIMVGLYAVVAKRVRITHSFQLTGSRARNFGMTVMIGAIPAALFLNLIIRPFLPRSILSDRLLLTFVNVGFLAVVLFGTAWCFRDHPERNV